MPGVFKHLRKSLTSSGQVRKYLGYALGEFLLVVLGILVALQINDWAENNRQRKLEAVYLGELLGEIKRDTTYLNEVIETLLDGANGAKSALKVLEGREEAETLAFLNQFKRSYVGGDWSINPIVWSELKSTGNLSLIRNRDVVKALSEYYNRLEHTIQIAQFETRDTYDGRMYDKSVFSGLDSEDFFHDLKLDTLHDPGVRGRIQADPEAVKLMRRITVSRMIVAEELKLLRGLGVNAILTLESEIN